MATSLLDVIPWSVWDVQFWLVFAVTAGFLHYLIWGRDDNLVPMPHSWPIVGNLFSLPKNEPLYVFANRWAKEINSPVVRLRFGFTDAVVLNDLASLQEALVERGDDFAGRPRNTIFEKVSNGFQDVAFSDVSPEWRQKRKILVAALRAFSIGAAFEERVATNWDIVRGLLDEHVGGGPFDPSTHAKLLVTNYQASVCFSKSFHLDDEDFLRFKRSFEIGAKYFGRQISVDKFKILKYLPFDMADLAEVKKVFTVVNDYTHKQVLEHKKTFHPDDVRDFTDYLLKAKYQAEEEEKQTILTDTHLTLIVNNVFAAGMGTQQVIVNWFFYLLAMYPDVQEKCYQEIHSVLGSDEPSIKDRAKLVYCEASVQEMLRLASLQMGVPRKTLTRTKICGYDVPAGTIVIPNHGALHSDPQYYPDPFTLRPERFLENGTVLRPRYFLPFGSGRRICAGETAARYTLLLVCIHMVRTYRLSAPPGVTMRLQHDLNLGAPLPYEIVIEKRH